MAYWLLKSDPESYSFSDLARDRQTVWDGIRNHQARLYVAQMRVGDECLMYHSGEDRSIVGTATVVKGPYSDPRAEDGRWLNVDIRCGKPLARPVGLSELRKHRTLSGMPILRQSRLSVCPVTAAQWRAIAGLAD